MFSVSDAIAVASVDESCPLEGHRLTSRIRIASTWLAALSALVAAGCDLGPPPHALLTIEDPQKVAGSAWSLSAGTERQQLETVELDRAIGFPLNITVVSKRVGEATVWVAVRDELDRLIAAGSVNTRLRRGGTPTAVILLAAVCETDSDCDDGLFCTGLESCADGICARGERPCVADFPCVSSSTCAELGGGDGDCNVAVNHALCPSGEHCDPNAGCSLGEGCNTDADCDDGLGCTGQERCVRFVCEQGTPPCLSPFECVISTCVELAGAISECSIGVVHALCPTDNYCDAGAGCVRGQRCDTAAECQDGLVCNGAELCVGFRCEAGVAAPYEDGDPCTLDGCNDARLLAGESSIFNLPDPSTDGNRCDLENGSAGICRFSQGGCRDSSCGDGYVDTLVANEVCDDGAANTDAWIATSHCNSTCTGPGPHCGDGSTDVGNEICDDGVGNTDGWSAAAHCGSSCAALGPYCGDGLIESGFEVCDDGVGNSDGWLATTHCNSTCTGAGSYCGDGLVDSAFESCDDGALNSDAWSLSGQCNSVCTGLSPRCGDGVPDVGDETCDDGASNSDGWSAAVHCDSSCTALGPYCGDGLTEVGFELCDEGAGNNDGWSATGHCDSSCTGLAPYCGDDNPDLGFELCDDGVDNGDAWSATCHCNSSCTALAICCGDGNLDGAFEACDDGDALDGGNGCDALCQRNDLCGDGQPQWLFEICDDGNTDDCTGDCLADCSGPVTVAGCGDGVRCGSEICDDGDTHECGACNADCTGPGTAGTCGDGLRCVGAEACDDGYTDACGGCNATCTDLGTGSVCGDSFVCPQVELCDDGNAMTEGEGYCVGDCTAIQICGDGRIDGSEQCDDGDLETDMCGGDCTVRAVELTKLFALDGAVGDRFGSSVSLSGDMLAVGAHRDSDNGFLSGSAYLFERNQGGPNNWGQVAKLLASDGASVDYFGESVSVGADTLVVGAPGNSDNGADSGSAYVFERNQGGANNWGEVVKLLAADAALEDQFGLSVGLSADTLVVGAPAGDDNGADSGSAYVFERNQGGANSWGEVVKLLASDGAGYDYFGWSVSVSGDILAVGAVWDDDKANDAGSVYVFDRNQGGPNNWGQVAKQTASDGAVGDRLGRSISVSGDSLVAGAAWDNNPGYETGSAYLFDRNQGGANNWGEVAKLSASDGNSYDYLGLSVSVSGDSIIAGAYMNDEKGSNAGAAYVFDSALAGPSSRSQVAKLTASNGKVLDYFGYSVSVGGDMAAVGSYRDDENGVDSGAVYLYRLPCRQCGGVGCPCASCPDGVVDISDGEQCDDNNGTAGDGCDGCVVEAGFKCGSTPSVCVRGYDITSCPGQLIANNQPAGQIDPIQQSGPCTILDVNVTVDISHASIAQLEVELRSPGGVNVRLHDHTGGVDIRGNYDVILTPDGPGLMTAFDGTVGQGQWELFIADTATPVWGFLNCWALHLLCQ